ncbi:hypothetical protein KEM52_005624 [Ascosphaera acerosa]|nr:hypothetical protein KEM52_005624 [Ascosphaera acerosa]
MDPSQAGEPSSAAGAPASSPSSSSSSSVRARGRAQANAQAQTPGPDGGQPAQAEAQRHARQPTAAQAAQTTPAGSSIAERIQSSASGLLRSAVNGARAPGAASEAAAGLAGMLSDKGASAASGSHAAGRRAAGTSHETTAAVAGLHRHGASRAGSALPSLDRANAGGGTVNDGAFREHGLSAAYDADSRGFQYLQASHELPSSLSREATWGQRWEEIRDSDGLNGRAPLEGGYRRGDGVEGKGKGKAAQSAEPSQAPDNLSQQDDTLSGLAAALEREAASDMEEEAMRDLSRRERERRDVNDRFEEVEPSYDADAELPPSLLHGTSYADIVLPSDGQDVLAILDRDDLATDQDNSDSSLMHEIDATTASPAIGIGIGQVEPPDSPLSHTPSRHELADGPNEAALIPGIESLLAHVRTAAASDLQGRPQWTALPSVSEWLEADSHYVDEVWGGALRPYVQAARREAEQRKAQGLADGGPGPAVRRLAMVLRHVREAGVSS